MYKTLFIALLSVFTLNACQSQNTAEEQYVLPQKEYQEKMAGIGDLQLLDVRTPDEYNAGHIEGAELAESVTVGPFARLRPGTRLDADVKVGNFVEIKKSHLEKGAKASHLSYLGDSQIGAEANIGAGTITCNYDGQNKYQTIIGAGAFIGSNSSLVAPVQIGDNALIGAGSVITSNVDADALSLARAEQRTIKQGAKRVKSKTKTGQS